MNSEGALDILKNFSLHTAGFGDTSLTAILRKPAWPLRSNEYLLSASPGNKPPGLFLEVERLQDNMLYCRRRGGFKAAPSRPEWPSAGKRYNHVMDYYSALKKEPALIHAQRNLRNTVISGRS